ncbi:MAG TPA: YlmC/YmxH family sporulation protein [Oscillospiraceae bacterium]|nr:YlmC/YmxH family sporulation protein [Oscillospiraceae bacterium]
MELSQLSRKEIINLHDGSRLGFVGDSDLVIDDQSGYIQAIIIYAKGGAGKVTNARELVIPWEAVKIIGEEVLVVDIAPDHGSRKYSRYE